MFGAIFRTKFLSRCVRVLSGIHCKDKNVVGKVEATDSLTAYLKTHFATRFAVLWHIMEESLPSTSVWQPHIL